MCASRCFALVGVYLRTRARLVRKLILFSMYRLVDIFFRCRICCQKRKENKEIPIKKKTRTSASIIIWYFSLSSNLLFIVIVHNFLKSLTEASSIILFFFSLSILFTKKAIIIWSHTHTCVCLDWERLKNHLSNKLRTPLLTRNKNTRCCCLYPHKPFSFTLFMCCSPPYIIPFGKTISLLLLLLLFFVCAKIKNK